MKQPAEHLKAWTLDFKSSNPQLLAQCLHHTGAQSSLNTLTLPLCFKLTLSFKNSDISAKVEHFRRKGNIGNTKESHFHAPQLEGLFLLPSGSRTSWKVVQVMKHK